MLSKEEITATAASAIFGKPLITNVYRSIVVEAIIAAALPDWRWVSADYFEYDFVHADGTRLEVKQSALKQTWVTKGDAKPSWDVAERKGAWKDGKWVPSPGRNADIYVLGLHDVIDETADHRDPAQWQFLVIPTSKLPTTARISLGPASRLANPVTVSGLPAAVAEARDKAGRP
ncbi:TPA: hypothetical protein VMX41_001798 [Streptococcus pyogenes]|nr:hypothetical protein [Streptococcus pyogenes]